MGRGWVPQSAGIATRASSRDSEQQPGKTTSSPRFPTLFQTTCQTFPVDRTTVVGSVNSLPDVWATSDGVTKARRVHDLVSRGEGGQGRLLRSSAHGRQYRHICATCLKRTSCGVWALSDLHLNINVDHASPNLRSLQRCPSNPEAAKNRATDMQGMLLLRF